jgi:hypothetical protein
MRAPALLAAFFTPGSEVKITDTKTGKVVFRGPAARSFSFVPPTGSAAATYLLEASLISGARYSETIPVASPVS